MLISRFGLMAVEAVSKNKFDFKHDGLIVMPDGKTIGGDGVLTVMVGALKEIRGEGNGKIMKIKPKVVKEIMGLKGDSFALTRTAYNMLDVMDREGIGDTIHEISMEELTGFDIPKGLQGARPFCQVDIDLMTRAVKLLEKMTKKNKKMTGLKLSIGNDGIELRGFIEATGQGVIAQVKTIDVGEMVGRVVRLR